MSGHNKWSTIKHKKGKADAARGRAFSKLIKEITVAARMGGGDPGGNPRLRTAIDDAKAENMPKDNITRAVKKGTGELEGVDYEETAYEGYGPGGVAILVEATTDNRNRATAEIRHVFSKYGGSMGEAGCVAWIFNRRGVVQVPTSAADEETVMMLALEAGAEDVVEEDGFFVIDTPTDALYAVQEAFEAEEIEVESAELEQVPSNKAALGAKETEQCLRLLSYLEDLEDASRVWTNAEFDDDAFNAFEA